MNFYRHQDRQSNSKESMKGKVNGQGRVSAFDRLGARKTEEEDMLDKEVDEELQEEQAQEEQWCPSGIFSRSQKRRVQRMRCRQIRAGRYYYDADDDQLPKKV